LLDLNKAKYSGCIVFDLRDRPKMMLIENVIFRIPDHIENLEIAL
jgi:hypothetical protein